jgi:hypothetical protein
MVVAGKLVGEEKTRWVKGGGESQLWLAAHGPS